MCVLLPRNFIVFGHYERNLHYLVLAVLIAHTMQCYASGKEIKHRNDFLVGLLTET